MSDERPDVDPLQSLIAYILEAEARGEPVDRQAMLREHPEHEQSLRDYFANIDKIKASGKEKQRVQTPPAFGDGCLLIGLGVLVGGVLGWQIFAWQLRSDPQTDSIYFYYYTFWGAFLGPFAIAILSSVLSLVAKSVRQNRSDSANHG